MSEGEAKVLKWVGTRPNRPDGVDKVTGRAKFGADLTLPNMLHGRVLRSPHPHARIVSIDLEKAKRRWTVERALVRDLDTFNRRSPGIRTTDRLRFLLAYHETERVDARV